MYPFVRKIAKAVGMRMTKQIYADALASGIPVAGSLVSGGLTYICFRPNCVRLRNHLMGFMLCDPAYYGMVCVCASGCTAGVPRGTVHWEKKRGCSKIALKNKKPR